MLYDLSLVHDKTTLQYRSELNRLIIPVAMWPVRNEYNWNKTELLADKWPMLHLERQHMSASISIIQGSAVPPEVNVLVLLAQDFSF